MNSAATSAAAPDRPLVSVIMNCYNGGRYLRQAIDSVLAQTYTDWEIVFWDNRSADDSAAIFRSYADSRLRYFLAPRHTVLGKARNLATGEARGDWIAPLDCDDVWLPRKLEMQIQVASGEGPDLGLVYARMNHMIEDDARTTAFALARRSGESIEASKPLREGNIFLDLLRDNFVPLGSALVRRSAYWSVGGIDPELKQAEDYDLFLKISKSYRARAVHEPCGMYRIHSANGSHFLADVGYEEAMAIVKRYLPLPEAKRALAMWQAEYAGFLLRRARYRDGMAKLLGGADMAVFTGKLLRFVAACLSRRRQA